MYVVCQFINIYRLDTSYVEVCMFTNLYQSETLKLNSLLININKMPKSMPVYYFILTRYI